MLWNRIFPAIICISLLGTINFTFNLLTPCRRGLHCATWFSLFRGCIPINAQFGSMHNHQIRETLPQRAWSVCMHNPTESSHLHTLRTSTHPVTVYPLSSAFSPVLCMLLSPCTVGVASIGEGLPMQEKKCSSWIETSYTPPHRPLYCQMMIGRTLCGTYRGHSPSMATSTHPT